MGGAPARARGVVLPNGAGGGGRAAIHDVRPVIMRGARRVTMITRMRMMLGIVSMRGVDHPPRLPMRMMERMGMGRGVMIRVGVGADVVFVRILVVVTVMLLMVLLIMMKMVDVVEGGTGAGCWMRRGGVRMVVRRRTTVAVVRGPCHCRQRRRRLQVHALASAPAQPPPLLGYAIERVGRLGKGVRILMLLVFLVVPVVGGRGRCCSRRLRGRAGVTTDFPCSRGQGAREAHVSC